MTVTEGTAASRLPAKRKMCTIEEALELTSIISISWLFWHFDGWFMIIEISILF